MGSFRLGIFSKLLVDGSSAQAVQSGTNHLLYLGRLTPEGD